MGRKKKSKNYFTQEVEDAIISYNNTESQIEKNRLYNLLIYPAFDKLVENLIHTFKFYYFDIPYEDVKHEVVVYITERMDKFKSGKGKAYSYFSIVGKNYLILNNNKNYKKLKSKEELQTVDDERDVVHEIFSQKQDDLLSVFIDEWTKEISEEIFILFPNDRDQAIADSVVELFRTRKHLDSFNKKYLYILIRERTGFSTDKITKVVNILKEDFYMEYEHFMRK